jgi:hypothetical protein
VLSFEVVWGRWGTFKIAKTGFALRTGYGL